MKLAGKYAEIHASNRSSDYKPEVFPNQKTMYSIAQQTTNSELKKALLDFQYPFTMNELKNSGYSSQVINEVLNIATNG
tara:strand:- start:118 stop:354 length:237 start_codon:yes stop_codon:yes gene_type:complete